MRQAVNGVIVSIIGGVAVVVIQWWIEPFAKPKPNEPVISNTKPVTSIASTQSARHSSPVAFTPSGSASSVQTSPEPEYKRYINAAAFTGHKQIMPVAVKGNLDASRNILEVLDAPLKQGLFSQAFFNDGIFERALNGESNAIAKLKLPKEIDMIVLLHAGEQQKNPIPDGLGAAKAKRAVAITLMDAQSGTVIKALKFIAEGAGFDDQFIEKAIKEDLAAKLEPVRQTLKKNNVH